MFDHWLRVVLIVSGGALLYVAWLGQSGCEAAQDVARKSPASAATQPADDPGFAVVELFTSEGCSSCPAAAPVLAELAEMRSRDGRRVFTLAFHVDYWNNLGWTDPFSLPAYSRRQEQYGRVLRLDNIYTPQAVVNGGTEFVGSDRQAADRAVRAALVTPASNKVAISIARDKAGGYRVTYSVAGDRAGSVLNLAVIEQGLSSDVLRGENAGRVLAEPSVVRWFDAVAIDSAGHGEVALSSITGLRPDHAQIVGYVQSRRTLAVSGATAAQFP